MLNLVQLVTVTQQGSGRNEILYFNFVHECIIDKSFDKLTQTATVILPKNLKYKDKNIYAGDNPLIKRGDKIKIECGYSPAIKTEFEGYISRVSNNVPIEIHCEDAMYVLKQTICPNISNATLNLDSISLDVLLKEMIGELVPYKNISADLGIIRINQASIGVVLEKLRTEYGLYSYFVDGTLYVGLPFQSFQAEEIFLIEKQFIDNTLEYLRSDDIKVKVKGVLIVDGNKEEVEIGDSDGDLRTIYQYGGTKEELKRVCQQYIDEYKYEGYRGVFTTFLAPSVNPGDRAKIASYLMPERNGVYRIRSVRKTFGVNGGRQEIELQTQIS